MSWATDRSAVQGRRLSCRVLPEPLGQVEVDLVVHRQLVGATRVFEMRARLERHAGQDWRKRRQCQALAHC